MAYNNNRLPPRQKMIILNLLCCKRILIFPDKRIIPLIILRRIAFYLTAFPVL